jgi:hypothetical protein
MRNKISLGLRVTGWANEAMPIVSPDAGSLAVLAGFVEGDVLLAVNDIAPRTFLSREWWIDESITLLELKVLRESLFISLRIDIPSVAHAADDETSRSLENASEAGQPEFRALFRPGRNPRALPADGVPNDIDQRIELVEFLQDDLAISRGRAEAKVDTLTLVERAIAEIEMRQRAPGHYTVEYDPLSIDAKW